MVCFLFGVTLLVLSALTILLNAGLVMLMHRYYPSTLASLKQKAQDKKTRSLFQPVGVGLVIISGILVTVYMVTQYTAI